MALGVSGFDYTTSSFNAAGGSLFAFMSVEDQIQEDYSTRDTFVFGRANVRDTFRVLSTDLNAAIARHGRVIINSKVEGVISGTPPGSDAFINELNFFAQVQVGYNYSGGEREEYVESFSAPENQTTQYTKFISHFFGDGFGRPAEPVINGPYSEFWYSFDLFAATGRPNGKLSVDLSNTIKVTSITFEDGTTPEEIGLELEFASGRISPNLEPATVPEPSASCLFGFLLIGVGFLVYREKASCRNSSVA